MAGDAATTDGGAEGGAGSGVVRADPALRRAVEMWVQLHDEIAAMSKQAAQKRKDKELLGVEITRLMRRQESDECMLRDGQRKLVCAQARRTAALKRDDLLQHLRRSVGADAADRAVLDVYSNRRVETKDVLRLVKSARG